MTQITTYPDYLGLVERLYIEMAAMYTNSIFYEASYSSWHNLTEQQRTFRLASVLYSAGTLHPNLTLPFWVPDWTCSWWLAPL